MKFTTVKHNVSNVDNFAPTINASQDVEVTVRERLSAAHAVPMHMLDLMLLHALIETGRAPCVHEVRSQNEEYGRFEPVILQLRKKTGVELLQQNVADLVSSE